MNELDLAEKELLSILVLNSKIGFDLLQLKPKHLKTKFNQLLMGAVIKSYKKHNVVDIAELVSSGFDADKIISVISDEYLPLTDVRRQFMVCQELILTDYKKRAINHLTQKLNNGEITCEIYSDKIEVINELSIKVFNKHLTVDEINDGISSSKQKITLKNYPTLNQMLQLVHGEFLIIGASTGVGKSGLLLNLMNDLMDRYQCIYFNMEMSKSTIYKRMVAIKSNIQLSYIEKPSTEYQSNLIRNAIKDIEVNEVVVEHKATYIHEIRNVLKVLKNDNKHTILFLDHIGLIRTASTKSQYERTTEVAKDLRQLCLDYDCTIIAASQLNRAAYNSDELNLSMLKDSGEIENSGSKIIFLYQDKNNTVNDLKPNMVLEIMKNRDGRYGKVYCEYDKAKQIFREVREWK